MKARTTAILLTAVLVVYFGLLGQRAVLLLQTGTGDDAARAAAGGLGGVSQAPFRLRRRGL
jgi:hypothetical protein